MVVRFQQRCYIHVDVHSALRPGSLDLELFPMQSELDIERYHAY